MKAVISEVDGEIKMDISQGFNNRWSDELERSVPALKGNEGGVCLKCNKHFTSVVDAIDHFIVIHSGGYKNE